MPKVSVIVATYRREEGVLRRALDSLAAQTYSDFEIILVDDNADVDWNGRVKRAFDAFCAANPGAAARLIANPVNLGSARTRNAGIEAAEGEYVTFLDDDDLCLPARIQNQLMPMQKERADYGVTDLALYSEEEKLIEIRRRGYIRDTAPEALLKYHLLHHITGTDTMMFRRDYLLKIGCFSPIDVGDEYYLMQKAIEGGGKFLYVPACDIKAYVHTGEGGLSSGSGKISGENTLYEHKKKYFSRLTRREIRYIRMRHYIVLAYAHLRAGDYAKFVFCGLMGAAVSPLGAMQILLGRK